MEIFWCILYIKNSSSFLSVVAYTRFYFDVFFRNYAIDLTIIFESTVYIEKEKQIESEITKILREKFSFRFIILEGQEERIGKQGLESRLIGTVANCSICKASENWLGRFSTIEQIRNGKLWLLHYLAAEGLTEQDKEAIADAITNTKVRIGRISEPV